MLSQPEYIALTTSPLLTGVDEKLVDDILNQGALHLFTHSEVVCTPQHFRRCLGILLSGALQVSRDSLSVSTLSPGDLFGAAALYSDEPDYTATLTGEADGRILLLDFSLVDGLLATSPKLRENYLRYLTGRIRFLSGRLHSVAAGDGEGKLARYLSDPQSPLNCPATQLAKRLGMGRATLYRAFQTLESAGAIRRDGRTITVESQDILSNYS